MPAFSRLLLALPILVTADLKVPSRRLDATKFENLTLAECSEVHTIEKALYDVIEPEDNIYGWGLQPAGFTAANSGCWKFAYPMCGGQHQSPVHIQTSSTGGHDRRLSDASADHAADHSSDHSADHASDHSAAAHSSPTPAPAPAHSTGHSDSSAHSTGHATDSHAAAGHATDSHAANGHSSDSHAAAAHSSADSHASSGGLLNHAKYGRINNKPKVKVDKWFRSIRADGVFGSIKVNGKVYVAKHMQLVTSSLHKVDNQHLHGELLIIHQEEHSTKGPWTPANHDKLDTIVVSVLFQQGAGYSKLWEAFGFPKDKAVLPRTWLDNAATKGMIGWEDAQIGKLVNKALAGNYYGYHGSLPVPPCWENVIYYVCETPLVVSEHQVEGLVAVLEDQFQRHHYVQRPVQRELSDPAKHKNNFKVTGSATDSCDHLEEKGAQTSAVCWKCDAGARKTPINVATEKATLHHHELVPGYDKPSYKYHPTTAYSERGEFGVNVRPAPDHSFGTLELGGRVYDAHMISVHAVGMHAIDDERYDGEVHIHHYMFGDWHGRDNLVRKTGKIPEHSAPHDPAADHAASGSNGSASTHDSHAADSHAADSHSTAGSHDTHAAGGHGGHRRLGANTSRRLDAFRGDSHEDENVLGGPSFQIIVVVPLKVFSIPSGDFMSNLEPHGLQSGKKAYLSHNDLKQVFNGDFYEYRGTLLFPPCSKETTHYIVYKEPLKISADQLYTEYPTRSGFDTTPGIVARPSLEINKNNVPLSALGSGKKCSSLKKGSWTYADTHCWPTHYPICDKKRQSPINIQTDQAYVAPAHHRDVMLHAVKYHPMSGMYVTHNGHALQVKDKLNGISHLGIGYAEILGNYYFLRQFHLHMPSEHVVDGHQHAAELHLVHQKQDHWGATAFENDDIMVIGILFDIGPEENKLLNQLYLPHAQHLDEMKNGWKMGVKDPIDLMRALGPILNGDFYRYEGSFTTPPCSEVVKWFLMKTSLSMSQEQFDAFKTIFPNPANARPFKPLYGRKVAMNQFEAPGEVYDPPKYEFYLDRYHGRDRDKPTPYIVLGGVVGGFVLMVAVMFATFIRQNSASTSKSAGGLTSEAVGRSRYNRM